MNIITLSIIAISLSMDAFSLSLIYGTCGINKKDKLILSTIVGIYHFIMPLFGLLIGNFLINKINFNQNLIVGIILTIISIEMIISSFKNKDENYFLNISGCFLFGLSVSIDSFTIGIGFPAITNNFLLASSIFAIISSSFTFLGLNIGNILNIKYGKLSTTVGGIILFILGILYIFK